MGDYRDSEEKIHNNILEMCGSVCGDGMQHICMPCTGALLLRYIPNKRDVSS